MNDRLIEARCFLYSKKLSDLGVESEDIPARVSFRASSIESFRERGKDNDDGEIDNESVMVYFKSGESMLIDLSYDQLKSMLE